MLQACRSPTPNRYGSVFTALPQWLVSMCEDALFPCSPVVGMWLARCIWHVTQPIGSGGWVGWPESQTQKQWNVWIVFIYHACFQNWNNNFQYFIRIQAGGIDKKYQYLQIPQTSPTCHKHLKVFVLSGIDQRVVINNAHPKALSATSCSANVIFSQWPDKNKECVQVKFFHVCKIHQNHGNIVKSCQVGTQAYGRTLLQASRGIAIPQYQSHPRY